jgi:hypothetical protein
MLSDGEAAIKALESFQINSKFVWNFHQSPAKLAEHNRIQLVCVPGHMGIDLNKTANQLATEDSSHPLIGPQPALSISAKAREMTRDWTSRKDKEHWQSTHGQKLVKGFLKKPFGGGLWEIAQSGQKPAKNDDRVAKRTLSFKRTFV